MLYRNLRQIKSPFGGEKHGHLGAIQAASMYSNSSATSWTVPVTQPAIPIIPIGTNAQDTAKIFNEWTISEKGIQTAEHVTCHMRNLILAAWTDEYYVELKDTAFKYNNVEPQDLLDHLLTNYATMDESEIKDARQSIYESPNFNSPTSIIERSKQKQRSNNKLVSNARPPPSAKKATCSSGNPSSRASRHSRATTADNHPAKSIRPNQPQRRFRKSRQAIHQQTPPSLRRRTDV